ncbi:MAG: hypothetical protein AB7U63_03845 [Porticoccaceae bacterium]|jgi:hypothetical protein
MIPDIEVQLQVAIKSLKDNVAPAVDKENSLAQEQMHLSLATIEIALKHLPLVHAYARKDIRENLAIADNLVAVCSREEDKAILRAGITAAQNALGNSELGFVQLQAAARELREKIGIVIIECSSTADAPAVEKLVLDMCGSTLAMARAWTKPHGFEPNPADVVDLEIQLGMAG